MGTIRILLKLIGMHRSALFCCGCLIIFVSLLTLMAPLYTQFVMEYIIPSGDIALIQFAFLSFLFFLVVKFVLTVLQDLSVAVFRQKSERSYCESYIASTFNLQLTEFNKHKAGKIINRFSVFFNDIEWFLCDFIFFVFYALFIFITLSIVMFQLSPLIFVVVLAFIPLHIINFRIHSHRLRLVSERYLSSQAALSSFTLQAIDGRDEIKSYFLHNIFAERLGKIVDDMHISMGSRQQNTYRQENLQGALVIINHVAVIIVGSYQAIQGNIGLGTLFFFLLLLHSFYSPIYRFSSVNQSLQAACIKIEEMAKIIESPHREQISAEITPPGAVNMLRLEQVHYNTILRGIDYTFRKGQIYFLTGESGSGKTTLFNLLTRFLVKDSGRILLDELDADDLSEFDLRRCIVYGIQEKLLFNASVVENIHLSVGQPADMKHIEHSCYFAVADEFIDALPQKHWSEVYEYGSNFSGGQQQRLALTRVFYYDAPIMLFDEPTSALDIVTERIFYERLHQLKANKIIIVVSHRPSTYCYADQILRLDQGKLYPVDVERVQYFNGKLCSQQEDLYRS